MAEHCERPRTPATRLTLRLPDETDDGFRLRAERAARIARMLVDACLANLCMRRYIADPALPYCVESVRRCPTVRVEYAQAIAIGGLGECLRTTRHKHWGGGPLLLPLRQDDWFFPHRITYVYRPQSLYNRRFEQRRRLKQLLGRRFAKLVGRAKWQTKQMFLERLTPDEQRAIRLRLRLAPGAFWRAARGRVFLTLPARSVQLEFDLDR